MIKIGTKRDLGRIPAILERTKLHTVCQEARCPNIGECFAQGTATFLILGDICTRGCSFCGVKKTALEKLPVDPEEPGRLAETLEQLHLNYVVITSVSRDDLPDGGAEHFVRTIREIRKINPRISIELLIPDFAGNLEALRMVAKEAPEVINHNLETVKRLYPKVRPQAIYERSLSFLRATKEMAPEVLVKSGLMLGLGEKREEVLETLRDLRQNGCQMLTLGQYFQPTGRHIPVERYIKDEEFHFLKQRAEELGFLFTAAGTFVRSSYRAKEAYEKAGKNKQREETPPERDR